MGEAMSSNVLAYELSVVDPVARRWHIVATVLACLSVIVGLGQAGYGTRAGIGLAMESSDPESLIWSPVMAAAGLAGLLATGAAVLAIAGRAPRLARAVLAVAAGLTVLVAMGLMGLCVAYRRATGWDQLTVVAGAIFAAVAGATALLYVATGLAVLRASRRADEAPAGWPAMRRCLLLIPVTFIVAAVIAFMLVIYLP